MNKGRSNIGPIVFSDMSGGLANAYPIHSIDNNQVSDCLNAVFQQGNSGGVKRAPGLTGYNEVSSELPFFSGAIRGWFKYITVTGAEYKIAVSGQHIYNVDLSARTITDLYTLSSDTECFAVNFFGKLWIVNGVDAVKIESDLSVSRIGIVAPSGFTAAAVGGGTLPAGDYIVYASYRREVAGLDVLYSAPQTIDTITVNGSQGIDVTVTLSSDDQVDGITIWATAADGADPYWIAEGENENGTISITSDTRNESLLMYELAAGNQLPLSINTIYATGKRLYGTASNSRKIYYSYPCQNEYDCERWATEYYVELPFTVYSLFAIGEDLFVNTLGGIYRFSYGDLSSKPQPIVQGAGNNQIFYFPKNMLKTIVEYNRAVFGVTNDGVRFFDGNTFSIDISKHIKPIIDTIIDDAGVYNPFGIVYRRSGVRTEYQISFRDSSIASNTNNRTIVLNIDELVIIDNNDYKAPWEYWTHGYCGAISTSSNQLIVAQYNTYYGVIAIETGNTMLDCLTDQSVLVTEVTNKRVYVKSKMIITELAGVDIWERIYFFASLGSDCAINLLITDASGYRDRMSIVHESADNPTFNIPGQPVMFPLVFNANPWINKFVKCKKNSVGNAVVIEIDQTADDSIFEISRIELFGTHERNHFV